MKLIIREQAADDLEGIFAWIARDNPRAAVSVVKRIRERLGRLVTPGLQHSGRPGQREGTRELIEGPYIIVYRVNEDRGEIEVLTIVYGAQNR